MSYKSIKDVVTMLQENGFVLKSQKGVEKGTYYSILRQAGLKK